MGCCLARVGAGGQHAWSVCEILVEHWVPLVGGVQVEDVVMIGFTQRDGESPVQVVMIVEEEYCFSSI